MRMSDEWRRDGDATSAVAASADGGGAPGSPGGGAHMISGDTPLCDLFLHPSPSAECQAPLPALFAHLTLLHGGVAEEMISEEESKKKNNKKTNKTKFVLSVL
jgi:hypothetical protein